MMLKTPLPNALPTSLSTSIPTTEMQVTSIRFERELIEQLKALARGQGYQALVRDILWEYVHQHSGDVPMRIQPQQIRAICAAQAQRTEYCAVTGQQINPQDGMWLGVTTENEFVPLCQRGVAVVQNQVQSVSG
jgi:hypothetical protein